MKDQDKRAVESMARCGISLEGLRGLFPQFPAEEIEEVYNAVNKYTNEGEIEQDIKCCGSDAR